MFVNSWEKMSNQPKQFNLNVRYQYPSTKKNDGKFRATRCIIHRHIILAALSRFEEPNIRLSAAKYILLLPKPTQDQHCAQQRKEKNIKHVSWF